ncbi:MAGUK p55 subfamily member 6b isoform X2 [Esox lucius]|uniref:Membrane palmitoylated protein 2 n=1 Tax=Esox lucius TaxID=8010 RepID=A0A6Q2XVW1_ESOLU|nr:MAGUK p55 subfamily member 6b isoform X2 [Esox lucius]
MVLVMEDACPNGVKVEVEPPLDAGGTRERLAGEGPSAELTDAAKTSGVMQQVLDNLGELPPSTGAKDIDLIFLRGIMESPIVRSLAKAHERLEDVRLEAVQDNNVELVTDILDDITALSVCDESAAELSKILQEPHFQSLLEAHDMVASKCYEAVPPAELSNEAKVNSALMQADAVRMIGIRKKAGEPLGVTFRVEKDDLVIARILHGGMIDRQGLLHVGDIIKEVNGRDVGNNPTELQEMLKDCSGGITLKILPSYRDAPAPPQVYVQPHFDYDPANDHLIPCREAGISFKRRDLLQIVNREDPNWWQACHVVGGATGLIPSQFLEEKRKAFVPRDFDGSGILCGTLPGKKKKKMMYLTAKNAEFDRHELQIYEEVAKMPPFQRKTLVLIGAQGVGRRSLKNRLVVLNPTRFGTTIPFTSRRPRDDELDGNSYRFVTRTEMEADVKAGRYLEHGEYDGNLYGTKMDSIHEVVNTGRTCILDVNPQALKVLKTSEFMPYVVFIAAPEFETLKAMHKAVVDAGITTKQLTDVDLRKTVDESARIQRAYNHYFDLTITNDNLDRAFETLQAAVDKLCSEPQWVPVNWVY